VESLRRWVQKPVTSGKGEIVLQASFTVAMGLSTKMVGLTDKAHIVEHG